MEVNMTVISCCTCGVTFAIADDWDMRLRRCHNTFYCPSGHAMSYPDKTKEETKIENLEKELARITETNKRNLKLLKGMKTKKRKTTRRK